jgi:hypothetical protein
MVTACLHAYLEKYAMYMRQPTGFEEKAEGIRPMGFRRLPEDHCVYQRGEDGYLSIYVDDTLLMSAMKDGIKLIKGQLSDLFVIK